MNTSNMIKEKLTELESFFKDEKTINESVSKVSVGWHINHSLEVINGISLSLMRSKEDDYKGKFNIKKSIFLLFQKFPRGKIKTSRTKKNNEISIEEINKNLVNAIKLLDKIENLAPKSHFKHGLFGVMNLKESKQLLEIHTEHHLKIIRDILK